ncbi:MAG: hypothetical protein WAV73_03890 [Candidatus Moraniibacteriota bacterium]
MQGTASVILSILVVVIVILLFKGGKSNYNKANNFLKLLKEKDFEKWKELGEPRIMLIMPNAIITNKGPYISDIRAYVKYANFGDFSDQELKIALEDVRNVFSIKPFDLIAVIAIYAIFIGALVYATLF